MPGPAPVWDVGCESAWGRPQPLGASPSADRGAFPAMSSSHDRHASRQVSPQQDGCAQQVQGESLGALKE